MLCLSPCDQFMIGKPGLLASNLWFHELYQLADSSAVNLKLWVLTARTNILEALLGLLAETVLSHKV